nr:translation initiation factor IF-2-like [Aegilops tauschii subsp. strangulata]
MSTREMPAAEVAHLVNEISNCKLSESEWQFGKRSYSRAHPPLGSAMMQLLTTQSAADALEQGKQYLPDRSMSDADDPDLGAAAMEEDDATGGGDRASGSGGGGGLEGWPDDDEEEHALRRPPVLNRARASPSAAPTTPGGAPKRRAGSQLQGSWPRKSKGSATATRREEAATKAARFHWAPKQPPTVSAAPLSLERSASASIIGGTEGSANTRRIDPLADLRDATEKNVREAREEQEEAERQREAAKAVQEEADAAAKAQADAMAKAQADATTKARADAAAKAQTEEDDYHNIRAATFNSQVQELAKWTTDLADSRRANATLRQQLGEAQTALRAKEEERSKMEQERDRLAKQLADQAEL